MEQSAKANVDHFIYLSSTGVMGRLTTLPADINHPCHPVTPYEKSKYQAELLVRKNINERHFQATVVRSTHIYGPRDFNTLQIYRLMKKWRILPLIDGGQSLFQPIYVTDLIHALTSCMEKSDVSLGKMYIVAGNERVTFNEFLALSAEAMSIDVRNLDVPASLAQILGSFSETVCKFLRLTPIITKSRIEFFTRNHIYVNRLITEDLGWVPQTKLLKGLTETIRWYGNHGLL
jgi:nucleoside-diphosphate-sugar epimerase